jgi:hypothetical protein
VKKPKKVRTTITATDGSSLVVYGQLVQENAQVYVWVANGAVLGFYNLSRFDGEQLTPSTLRAVLTAA